MVLFREIGADGPGEKEQGRADFKDSASPIFDGTMGNDRENHKSTKADSNEFHCPEFSADSGTKATSSIQAEP